LWVNFIPATQVTEADDTASNNPHRLIEDKDIIKRGHPIRLELVIVLSRRCKPYLAHIKKEQTGTRSAPVLNIGYFKPF